MAHPDHTEPIPDHEHGSSTHWANLGCTHPKCLAVRNQAKKRNREDRKQARVYIPQVMPDGRTEMRWVHPALAPHNSTNPRRHGTVYGRREFGCDCPHCEVVRKAHPDH